MKCILEFTNKFPLTNNVSPNFALRKLDFKTTGCKIRFKHGEFQFFGLFCIHSESSYTLTKIVNLILAFLTMIIIIATGYGNEFIA
jgi:hypothetical protein